MGPVLRALDTLGGSARPPEVCAQVANDLRLHESELLALLPSGSRRFDNQVAWARFYLNRAGYLDASKRGVWSLTELGLANRDLDNSKALEIFKEQHATFAAAGSAAAAASGDDEVAPEPKGEVPLIGGDFRGEFLGRLQGLTPLGFEKFSRRLLLESGFQEVEITGRSGDGGIDGIGRLSVNPLVSTKVLFQCKRYTGNVSPDKVRDFRGAMAGRSENGIIITTGSFTADARREALREGVAPIELVDGVRLVALCEQLGLGLLRVETFQVDSAFFHEFA